MLVLYYIMIVRYYTALYDLIAQNVRCSSTASHNTSHAIDCLGVLAQGDALRLGEFCRRVTQTVTSAPLGPLMLMSLAVIARYFNESDQFNSECD
jgi:hypothetical protein